MKNYVYSFGGGTADGDGKMKDVLGGKGAGLAEMCRAGVPVPPDSPFPPKSAISIFRTATKFRTRLIDQDSEKPWRSSEKAGRQEARRSLEPAAGERPLRREVFHARHDEHHPQPRAERRDRRRAGQRSARIRASPTIPTAASFRCSAKWRSISTWRSSTTSSIRAQAQGQGETRYRPYRGRSEGDHRRLQEAGPEGNQEAVSAGRARAARHVARCRVPLLVESQGRLLPQDGKDSGRNRHRRERAGHGVRQHGRYFRHRRGLHARPRHRREGLLRRVPGQRAGRGRGRGHPHAAADFRARKDHAGGVPAAARDHRRASRSTIATCRISSSPSKKARCTCCRPATASGPVPRRCASPSRWSKRG